MVEDVFIEYADDTIGRVVRDLQSQMEDASSVSKVRLKETSMKRKDSNRSLFTLKESMQVAVSLMLNDIRNFAMLYKTFRETHFEFFDLEESKSELSYGEQEHSLSDRVPCDPQLSKDFYLLELIDTFRNTGEASLLDQLMRECDESSESEEELTPAYSAKMVNINVIQEDDAESDCA